MLLPESRVSGTMVTFACRMTFSVKCSKIIVSPMRSFNQIARGKKTSNQHSSSMCIKPTNQTKVYQKINGFQPAAAPLRKRALWEIERSIGVIAPLFNNSDDVPVIMILYHLIIMRDAQWLLLANYLRVYPAHSSSWLNQNWLPQPVHVLGMLLIPHLCYSLP